MEDFPENKPIYKDSGLWQMRSDDMKHVLIQQSHDETFKSFVRKCKNFDSKDRINNG